MEGNRITCTKKYQYGCAGSWYPLRMGTFIFLDTETTGINPARDRIIEVAALKWKDGKILDRFEALVHPGVPIPYEIKLLTGISDDDVKNAPRFLEVKEKLVAFIGDDPIVGHNTQFDTGFLKSHHLTLKNPEIDTVVLARILLRKESSYALEVLMKKYGLTLRNSHRAIADAETTISFFEFLLWKITEIPKEVFEELERI